MERYKILADIISEIVQKYLKLDQDEIESLLEELEIRLK